MPKNYWFRRKKYGWGWRPVTWQGWLAVILYVVIAIGLIFIVDADSSFWQMLLTLVLPVIILTIGLVLLAYETGETPRWQWGEKRKDDML